MSQPKLDRIAQDLNVLDGLPTIRDTGITVSEVVKAVMGGNTADDVLAEYPQLESEDVTQALVYAVEDLSNETRRFVFDTRSPIAAIEGYSELLLHDTNLDEAEKREFIEALSHRSTQLAAILFELNHYPFIMYRFDNLGWSSIDLPVLLDSLFKQRSYFTKAADIDIDVPDGLPLAKGNSYIGYVIGCLLIDSIWTGLKGTSASIHVKQVNERLIIQITRKFLLTQPNPPLTKLISPQNLTIRMVAYIIRQHGSELKIHPTEGGVTFEFELPIWSEPHE